MTSQFEVGLFLVLIASAIPAMAEPTYESGTAYPAGSSGDTHSPGPTETPVASPTEAPPSASNDDEDDAEPAASCPDGLDRFLRWYLPLSKGEMRQWLPELRRQVQSSGSSTVVECLWKIGGEDLSLRELRGMRRVLRYLSYPLRVLDQKLRARIAEKRKNEKRSVAASEPKGDAIAALVDTALTHRSYRKRGEAVRELAEREGRGEPVLSYLLAQSKLSSNTERIQEIHRLIQDIQALLVPRSSRE